MKLLIRAEAESDLNSGFRWYESQLSGLGHEFLATVHQQIELILERPEAYPRVHPRLRRSLTTRFPYAIFYLIQGNALVIVSVAHQAQDPEHWRVRE